METYRPILIDVQRLPANIQAWMIHQQRRGFAAKTIQRRAGALVSLLAFVAPLTIDGVTPELIQEWLAGFVAPRTRHHYLSDVSLWFRWAIPRQLATANPCDLVDGPRLPRALPRPIPRDQLGLAITTAAGRLRTAVILGAYAGLRVSEIAALAAEDVWLGDDARIIVRNGKGAKDRVIPLHPALACELAHYPPHGRICAGTGNGWSVMIRAHLHHCGIDASAHQLRHTFGTELARSSNGDLLLCAALLGHSQPQTSMIYCQLAGGRGQGAIAGMYAA